MNLAALSSLRQPQQDNQRFIKKCLAFIVQNLVLCIYMVVRKVQSFADGRGALRLLAAVTRPSYFVLVSFQLTPPGQLS